jgi:MFS transporter, PPP family, 3-phenylpropionic acid transporter
MADASSEPGTWTLRLYYAAAFAALGVYIPYFPAWLALEGFVGLRMSAITALLPGMSIVAPPLFGLLADRFGLRTSLLRVASAGAFLAFAAIFVLAASGAKIGFLPLFLAVMAFALFRSPMILLADVVALEQTANYGRLRLWGSIGFLGMALIAGSWLDGPAALGIPGTIALSLLLAFVAATRLKADASAPARPAWQLAGSMLRSADFVWFLCAAFLWLGAHAGYDLCITLHLRELGASGTLIGFGWALATLVEVLWMALSARALRRWSPVRLFGVGVSAAAVRWLLLGSIESLPLLLALQPLHALSFGVVWIAALAHLKQRGRDALATAQGLFGAALACGGVIGMLAWGQLYERAGGAAVFRGCALVGGLSILATLVFAAKSRVGPNVSAAAATASRER